MSRRKLLVPPGSIATFDEILKDAGEDYPVTVMFFGKRGSVYDSKATGVSHATNVYAPKWYFDSGVWTMHQNNALQFTSGGGFSGDDHLTITMSAPTGVTFNESRVARLYINGVFEAENANFPKLIVINSLCGKTGSFPTTETFEFDEVKIWNKVLSDAEVTENWNTRLDVDNLPSDLIKYFTFDDENGDTGHENHVTGLQELVFVNSTDDPYFAAETAPILNLRVDTVNGGADIRTGDTAIAVVGVGLDTITTVTIEGETQFINSGATDTLLEFDLVQVGYTYGDFAVDFSDGTNTIQRTVTIIPAAGKTFVSVGAYIEPDLSERLLASPDMVTGDTVRYDEIAGLEILSSLAFEYTGVLNQIVFEWDYFHDGAWQSAASATINRLVGANQAPNVTASNTTIEFAFGGAGLAKSNSTLVAWLASAIVTDDSNQELDAPGNITALADPIQPGSYVVTFTSEEDGGGLTGSDTATLIVLEADELNSAPVVTAPSDASITYVFTTAGLAKNDATLVAWLASATVVDDYDVGLTATGDVSALADPIPAGTYTITFAATDSGFLSDSDTAELVVSEASIVTTPVAGSVELQWDILALVSSPLVLQWDILNASIINNIPLPNRIMKIR